MFPDIRPEIRLVRRSAIKKTKMKDYSDEILKIIMSSVRLESAELNGQRHIPQIVEWPEVIRLMNSFINSEIGQMESEIVSLTEQLLESDSLIAAHKKKPPGREYRSKSEKKKSNMMNF